MAPTMMVGATGSPLADGLVDGLREGLSRPKHLTGHRSIDLHHPAIGGVHCEEPELLILIHRAVRSSVELDLRRPLRPILGRCLLQLAHHLGGVLIAEARSWDHHLDDGPTVVETAHLGGLSGLLEHLPSELDQVPLSDSGIGAIRGADDLPRIKYAGA